MACRCTRKTGLEGISFGLVTGGSRVTSTSLVTSTMPSLLTTTTKTVASEPAVAFIPTTKTAETVSVLPDMKFPSPFQPSTGKSLPADAGGAAVDIRAAPGGIGPARVPGFPGGLDPRLFPFLPGFVQPVPQFPGFFRSQSGGPRAAAPGGKSFSKAKASAKQQEKAAIQAAVKAPGISKAAVKLPSTPREKTRRAAVGAVSAGLGSAVLLGLGPMGALGVGAVAGVLLLARKG